ncbi:MAG: UvrD-helicase domain-containing protein [Desulfobacterales bacterium]
MNSSGFKSKNFFYDKAIQSLNPSQREAVMFREGALLVIAGAGSGKTRTLTHRVAALVHEGVSPRSILLLTFTRKAAAEMVTRAQILLDDRCKTISGGTFHSFANEMLHRYGKHIGFSEGFAVIDRVDAEDLISMIRKENTLSSRYRRFPKKKTLMDIFSRSANKVKTIEDIVHQEYGHFSSALGGILLVYEEYKRNKAVHRLLDYDDLLIFLKRLLMENRSLRDRISAFYRYIMVDEYQDTNKVQAEILYLLSSANKNIMVVGDDSQSIYSFRGADFKNILRFPERYPACKIIRLEENYRSVQPILSLSNQIIEMAAEKYDKRLFTSKKEGAAPLLVEAADEVSQSKFVIDRVHELRNRGVKLNDIAVLFRAGFHSFGLEIELAREGIPFNKVGGFKFVESAHIKDVLAHLRVLCNPRDRVSWQRILMLVENIGPLKARKIYETVIQENRGVQGFVETEFSSGIEPHIDKLKSLYRTIEAQNPTVGDLGGIILEYYLPIVRRKFDDYPKRIKDLEQLLLIINRYGDLSLFLTDMALEPPNTSVDDIMDAGTSKEDRLTLSTIHSAKGLEWHTVFIIWALDGRFPSMYALEQEHLLEEERRLMYVAATRAKEKLYFLYPTNIYDRNTNILLDRPSRFLYELGEDVLKKAFTASAEGWSSGSVNI